MKLNNQEKYTGILSEYEKTIFCRNKLKFVGRVRVHANDNNEWMFASKFKIY